MSLIVRGHATKKGDKNEGIFLDAPKDAVQKHVVLDNLEVTGFGSTGISMVSTQRSKTGFQDVTISKTKVYGNYGTGISSTDDIAFSSNNTIFAHRNLRITDCDVSKNFDGNGIILSGVDGATVEYTRASGNRSDGGALGMWAWCARNVTFRYCIANSTRGTNDAGGFDLDGGTVNCVVDHCLSFDNDGPGYMHCDFTDAPRTHGNIMRDSISVDDGRRKHKGAPYGFGFVVYGTGLFDCKILRNLVIINTLNPDWEGNGALFAVFIRTEKLPLSVQRLEGGVFEGNTVYLRNKGPVSVWNDFPQENQPQLSFRNNTYGGAVPATFQVATANNGKPLDLGGWRTLGNDVQESPIRYAKELGDLTRLKPRDLPGFFKRVTSKIR